MTGAQIHDAAARRAYALSGRAIFTLVGRESRFTYQVVAAPALPNATALMWFVSVLVGPDNGTDYQYLGTIAVGVGEDIERATYRHGRKSKIGKDARSNVAFAWCWERLDELDRHGVEFWHAGKCGRCGKRLTDPESISTGLGPVCGGR